MVVIAYVISVLIFVIKKVNIVTSLFFSFILLFVISYTLLLVYNFLGFSGFAIPLCITILIIYGLSHLDLKPYQSLLEIKKDTYFYFFLAIIVVVGIAGLYGGDFSYDGKAYHVDAIYGLYSQGNIINNDNFFHFYAKAYPKLGDYILGGFGDIFKHFNINYYFLGNILASFLLYLVVYKMSDILGIQSENHKSLIALFVVLNPIVMYEMTTGLGDILFVFLLLSALYLCLLSYHRFAFILFIVAVIGMINIKYSGPFLGFILCLLYRFKHLRAIQYKDYMLLLLFIPGFLFYGHNYLEFGTPLYPFFNSEDLHNFFNNLSHAPVGINGHTLKEILYSNFYVPHIQTIDQLLHIESYSFTSIAKKLFTGYFWQLNNYGGIWIVMVVFLPLFFYTIIKERNKSLIMFSGLMLVLYGMQSLKREVRYFIYITLLGYLGFFYLVEKYPKFNIIKTILVPINIGFISFYTLALGYTQTLTHNTQEINNQRLHESDNILFFEHSDYTSLFYHTHYVINKGKHLNQSGQLLQYKFWNLKKPNKQDNLHNSILIRTPNINNTIAQYLKENGYDFVYDETIGFIVQ